MSVILTCIALHVECRFNKTRLLLGFLPAVNSKVISFHISGKVCLYTTVVQWNHSHSKYHNVPVVKNNFCFVLFFSTRYVVDTEMEESWISCSISIK